jgi:hypothetical protein
MLCPHWLGRSIIQVPNARVRTSTRCLALIQLKAFQEFFRSIALLCINKVKQPFPVFFSPSPELAARYLPHAMIITIVFEAVLMQRTCVWDQTTSRGVVWTTHINSKLWLDYDLTAMLITEAINGISKGRWPERSNECRNLTVRR